MACCLATLLLGACTSGNGTSRANDDVNRRGGASPNGPIQDLLRKRAERLRAGDLEGYLAGLGPAARAFEEPIARVALTMPLSKIDMELNEATISDDGARFRTASVHLIYNFTELPEDNPFRVRFLYDIDRQPDRSWLVVKSKFDDRPNVPLPPPLWPNGPVEFTRSPHFLVMARPGVPKVAEGVAAAEKGYSNLLPKLPLEVDPRALLVLAKDKKEFGSDNVGQQQVFYSPVPGSNLFKPEERLVFADLSAVLAIGVGQNPEARAPEVVFQHELAHLALSRFTRPCTTPWVVEGAATVLADERGRNQWSGLAADETKLASLQLNGGVSYPFANAAVLYLVESAGAEKFFDFYQNFKNLPELRCSGGIANVRSRLDERLLRRYYSFGVEDLEGFARGYIRKAVAGPSRTP